MKLLYKGVNSEVLENIVRDNSDEFLYDKCREVVENEEGYDEWAGQTIEAIMRNIDKEIE